MIELANENIGRKVKILNITGHCLDLGSIGTIQEVDMFEGEPWYQVRGIRGEQEIVQILLREDFEYADEE